MVGLDFFFSSRDNVETRSSDSWQPPDLSHLPENEAVLENVDSRSEEQQRMDEVDEFVQMFHAEMPEWAENVEFIKVYDPENWPEEQLPRHIWNEEEIARATAPQDHGLIPTEVEADGDKTEEELAEQLALGYFAFRNTESSQRLFNEVFNEFKPSEHVFRNILTGMSKQEFAEVNSDSAEWRSPFPEAVDRLTEELNSDIDELEERTEKVQEKVASGDYDLREVWSLASGAPKIDFPVKYSNGMLRPENYKARLEGPLFALEHEAEISEGPFNDLLAGNSIKSVLSVTGYEFDEIEEVRHDSSVDSYELEDGTLKVGDQFHKEWRNQGAVIDLERQKDDMQRYHKKFNENSEFWIWQNLKDGDLEGDEHGIPATEELLESVSAQLTEILDSQETAEIMRDPMPYAKLARDGIAMAYLAEDIEGEEYRQSLEKAASQYGLLD